MKIPVSRFDLLEPIGEGGMASVWRAVHREQGVEAAVKVLTRRFNSEDLAEALRAEVRAMALLNHPNIVSVFDHGTIDRAAHVASGGHLPEGSPWVALEYVPGGTLTDLYPALTWPLLRSVLLQLLSALGHAHSHGVVHRDLKLANILLSTRDARIKLTDFGIAYALQQHEEGKGGEPMHAGTPRYMAPEQLDARVHEQGPWTDLYALGVLAWRLSTGLMPFPDAPDAQAEAKRRGLLYPFRARFQVPPGFPGWCARMMSPTPRDRFQSAADARFVLERLPTALEEPPTGPTRLIADTSLPPPLTVRIPRATPAPIPRSWRTAETWRRPVELVGCGLQLVSLRGVDFVGRTELRDDLWEELRAVHHTGGTRVVVIHGPSGYGKSSLASWLARRAEEVGAATALRTDWTDEVYGGLPGLLARRFRCMGATAQVTQARIDAHLARHPGKERGERTRLLQLLKPDPNDPEVHQEERFSLLTRTLRRMTRLRPAVLHFDDAHADPESFLFARKLLEANAPPPLLIVLTVQAEALALSAPAQEALQDVLDAGARQVQVGPLPLEHQVDFVQGLLSLDAALAVQVARRTEGNPLFASQLLEDWVSRDALELGMTGFRLRNPLDVPLPANLAQVWHGRVEALLAAIGAHLRVPLELAAVLGSRVDRKEWNALCQRAGWPGNEAVADALIARHLAIADVAGFRFVHGMLREAILQTAGQAGRLPNHHRSAADALMERGADPVRIGRHLVQANAGEEAIDPLEAGAQQATARGDYDEAIELLRARTALMRQVKVPQTDSRWGRGWVAQAELYARTEQWEMAESLTRQAARFAAEHDWSHVEVEALMLLVENRGTTSGEAQALLDRAYQVAVQPGNEDTLAAVCLLASEVARRRGALEEAVEHGRRAVKHVITHGGMRRCRCEVALAQTLLKLERLEDAERHLNRAEQLAVRQNHAFDRAVCIYLRARVAQKRGQLAAAARAFQEATDRFSALGDGNAWAMRAHLGLVLAEQGDLQAAGALFEQVLNAPSQLGMLLAHLGSLVTHADDVDTAGFSIHLGAVDRYVAKGWCDPLAAHLAEIAAARADRGGFAARARRLRGLASAQRERLAS